MVDEGPHRFVTLLSTVLREDVMISGSQAGLQKSLLTACIRGDAQCIERLTEAKVDVNLEDNSRQLSRTPLHEVKTLRRCKLAFP